MGADLTRSEDRLRACSLCIGLDGIAYLAWRGWDEPLEWTTRRLVQVLDA
jgi:hypothetical protein